MYSNVPLGFGANGAKVVSMTNNKPKLLLHNTKGMGSKIHSVFALFIITFHSLSFEQPSVLILQLLVCIYNLVLGFLQFCIIDYCLPLLFFIIRFPSTY